MNPRLSRRSVLAQVLFTTPACWAVLAGAADDHKPAARSANLISFSDPKLPEDEALLAGVRLRHDKPLPAAEALLTIANDQNYSDVRRRRAILLFLRYYAAPPTPLAEVGARLRQAGHKWLSRQNVKAIVALGGKTPVQMEPGHVFWVQFKLPKADSSTVYFRIEGELSENQFWDVLRNANGGAQATNKILEIGYSLRDPDDRGLLPRGEE